MPEARHAQGVTFNREESVTTYLQPALAPRDFDYTSIPTDIADQMRAAADRVRNLHRATVIDVGRELIAIKNQVEHGQFVAWVERELGMSIRAAQRAMQAAEMVSKNDKLSYLPKDGLLTLASRAAAPIMDEVIARVEAGERPSVAEIKERVEGARREEQRAAEDAKLTPQQRKSKARRQAEKRQRRLERERERAKREAAATAAAKAAIEILLDRHGDGAAEFVAQLDRVGIWRISRILGDPEQLAAIRAESSAVPAVPKAVDPENDDEPPLPFMNGVDQPVAAAPAN